jgi:hypothetical protein
VVPSASAASSRMRFDKLFEPGSLTVPAIRCTGAISSDSIFSARIIGSKSSFDSIYDMKSQVKEIHLGAAL